MLLESVIKMLVSSAKRTILLYLGIIFGKSFIYSRKSRGPRGPVYVYRLPSVPSSLRALLVIPLTVLTTCINHRRNSTKICCAVSGALPPICNKHQLPTSRQWRTERGGLGCSNPPPKF